MSGVLYLEASFTSVRQTQPRPDTTTWLTRPLPHGVRAPQRRISTIRRVFGLKSIHIIRPAGTIMPNRYTNPTLLTSKTRLVPIFLILSGTNGQIEKKS